MKLDKATIGFIAITIAIIIFIGVLLIALGFIGITAIMPRPRPPPPTTSIVHENSIADNSVITLAGSLDHPVEIVSTQDNGESEEVSETGQETTPDTQPEQETTPDTQPEQETTPSAPPEQETGESCRIPTAPHGATICSSKDAEHIQQQYIFECVDGSWQYKQDCGSPARCFALSEHSAECV